MPSNPILVTGSSTETGRSSSSESGTLKANSMSKLATAFLIIAGLLLLVIGGSILLAPHSFYASNGIALGNDPNLLSEIRAPGGMLTASGLFALIGALRSNLASMTILLLVLVYGSFGVARIVSIMIDGMPASGIVAAAAIELLVAAVGLFVLWRTRQ